jgi:hypothetical protein
MRDKMTGGYGSVNKPEATRFFRRDWGAAILVALLPFVVLWWMVPFVGKYSIGNDYCKYWIPNQLYLMFSVFNRTFPLYVPGFNGGWTASVLTLGQLFHPISWIAVITPGYWNGHAQQIITMIRLIELGATSALIFLFLRKLRLSIIPALVLSFITVFNLRMLDMFRYSASLENYTAMLSLCAVLGWFYLSPKNYFLPFSISIFSWLLVVGGHPQMMFIGFMGAAFVCIVFPFYASCLLADESPLTLRRVLKFWVITAFSVTLGILLASVYTLPFYFEYLKENYRYAAGNFNWACSYQDAFSGILCNFVNPFFSDVHTAFGGSSLVLLAMLLPIAGVFCLRKAWPVLFLWAGCVIVLIMAAGYSGPLYYYFWNYFPFARTFRVPGRLCMVLPFIFMLILVWILQQKPVRLRLISREISVYPVVPAAIVALIIFIMSKSFNYSELAAAPRFVPANLNAIPPIALSVFFVCGVVCLASIFLYGISNKLRTVAAVVMFATVLAGTAVVLRYGTWIVEGFEKTRTFARMQDDLRQRLVYRDVTGERYRLMTEEHLSHTFIEPSMARVCRRYETVNSKDEAYKRLSELREIDLVYVQGWEGYKSKNSDSDPNIDSVELKFSSFNNLIFDVVSSQPAFFVFSYPYSSRWQAKIDGKNAPVYKCNAIEHAVRILPGKHSIEFRYRSPATITGVVVSSITLVVIIWLFCRNPAMAKIRWLAMIVTVVFCVLLPAVVCYSFYNGGNIGTKYTWTSMQIQPNLSSRYNLAYGRKTTMSGTGAVSHSSLGVDGDRDGILGFFASDTNQAWWQVDLGEEKIVSEVVIYKMRDGSSSLGIPFEVLLSLDGSTLSYKQTITEETAGDCWSISVPEIQARFVGLRTLNVGLLSFSEVEVYK